jgi:hypothetical protein
MTEKQTRVRVLLDRDCASPRDDDNVGTMACWHRRYHLGDVQPTCTPEEYIAELPPESLILPLYLYDHSGITIRTMPFSCPWDSGQVGIIHVAPDKIADEFGEGEPGRALAHACLTAEVEQYAHYLENECYGFVIEEGETCNLGHVHWTETDSCWGFIGADPMTNGMAEHVPAELHDALKAAFEKVEV